RGIRPLPNVQPVLAGQSVEETLVSYGVKVPATSFAKLPYLAGAVAAEIGFPVALKIVSPQAVHKTEVGGVALNIASEDAAVTAACEMEARLLAADPNAEIEGYMVQQMIDGLEVIAGVRDDPQFGPVLALGFGGVLVEAIGDVSFRLLPVAAADVADMLDELRAKALLGEFRGASARDVAALIDCVVALSNAYLDLRGEFLDIEINPLMVGLAGEGVCAVDIRAIGRETDD
ncbi:MAG: hypothetical protein CMM16_04060, partial [Rhodospirillaceae bacterium]|nr:hypothetical protein [Rhodospirillaceae bacterium]